MNKKIWEENNGIAKNGKLEDRRVISGWTELETGKRREDEREEVLRKKEGEKRDERRREEWLKQEVERREEEK